MNQANPKEPQWLTDLRRSIAAGGTRFGARVEK